MSKEKFSFKLMLSLIHIVHVEKLKSFASKFLFYFRVCVCVFRRKKAIELLRSKCTQYSFSAVKIFVIVESFGG